MLLGTRSLAAGDIRKYEIDYRPYLCYGNKLSTVSVTVSADALSTVDTVTIYSAESGAEQRYDWTWGADGDICTSVSVYKFYSESGTVPVEIDGILYRSNDCPEGVECTVVKARGYNSNCNEVGIQGTVERELTAVY